MTDTAVAFTDPMPAFYLELRSRLLASLRARGLTRHGGARLLLRGALFAASGAACYAMILAQVFGWTGQWLLAIGLGTSMFLFGLTLAHDASHGSLSRSERWNRVFSYAYDAVGVSSWVTNFNHLRSHHVAMNVFGVDVAVGSDVWPAFRMHPDAPHRPWFRFQHVYFPIAYSLATLQKWLLLDVVELVRGGVLRGTRDGRRGRFLLLIGFKALVFVYAVLVPFRVLALPWWQIGLGLLSMHLIPGMLIALTFQVTHIADGNAFPSREDGPLPESWALHVLRTTTDLMPESRSINWLSAGLNAHVLHHLFPQISHVHFPILSPIVQEVALKYGLPYRQHTRLTEALASHVRVLARLGRRPSVIPLQVGPG